MTRRLRGVRHGVLAAIGGVLALAVVSSATAENAKPQETRGVSIASTKVLPLGGQIPELEGYALRIRTIVLEPGAVVGYHSHANRPVVAHLLSGEYTEHRDGRAEIVHEPGEQWVEGADLAHWSENRGSERTFLLNVDVLPLQ